jgi:hypothetical protein
MTDQKSTLQYNAYEMANYYHAVYLKQLLQLARRLPGDVFDREDFIDSILQSIHEHRFIKCHFSLN